MVLSASSFYGMIFLARLTIMAQYLKMYIDASGYQDLFSFDYGSSGASPVAGLTLSGSTLYGMTNNPGTVFKYQLPDSWNGSSCGWYTWQFKFG